MDGYTKGMEIKAMIQIFFFSFSSVNKNKEYALPFVRKKKDQLGT